MTLTIAIWRPDFVILGADRLSRWFADRPIGEPEYTEVTKVGIDSRLPIGWPNRGLASLADSELTEAVGRAIEEVPEALWGVPFNGTKQVAETLRPLVAARRDQIPDLYHDHAQVEVAIGIGVGSAVRLELIVDDLKVKWLKGGMVHPTEALEGFFVQGRFATDEGRFGPGNERPDKTIRRVVKMLKEGIREEARRLKGQNLVCGLGGDVVLVTPDEARLAAHFKLPIRSRQK